MTLTFALPNIVYDKEALRYVGSQFSIKSFTKFLRLQVSTGDFYEDFKQNP